jgi:biopolymer transport protein ExbD
MNLRPRRPEPPRVELTPLIDVVFLLLIFFMVSTTFDKQTRLEVDLPEAETVAQPEQEPEQIAITIDVNGHFYVNDEELVRHDLDTLKATLRKIADGRDDLPVVISGDKAAPYQAAMTVMDAAGQLGLSRLSFVARTASGDDEP